MWLKKLSVLWLHILFSPGVRVHRTTEIKIVTLAKHSLWAPWWRFM